MGLRTVLRQSAEVHTRAAVELGEVGMRTVWNEMYHGHTRSVEKANSPDSMHDSHVANVVRAARLVGEMARSGNDFLGLFKAAEKYRLVEMEEERFRELTIQAYVLAAADHDLANVVDGVDWGSGEGMALKKIVATGAEAKSKEMYKDHVDHVGSGQGWSENEMGFVKNLGAEWIGGTVFHPNFGKEQAFQLELVDQVAAMFNPNAVSGVIGLIAENEDRWKHSDIKSDKFNPQDFLGGFVKWRFSEAQKQFGIGMDQFLSEIGKYSLANWESFCETMGIVEDRESLKAFIEKKGWVGFVDQKLKRQTEIGQEIFGNSELTYEVAMDKVEQNLVRVNELCDGYRREFWKEGDLFEIKSRDEGVHGTSADVQTAVDSSMAKRPEESMQEFMERMNSQFGKTGN